MSYPYFSGSNVTHGPVFCPKPNHIKPCWCRGLALCATNVGQRRCRRLVKGEAVHCWQHNPEEKR